MRHSAFPPPRDFHCFGIYGFSAVLRTLPKAPATPGAGRQVRVVAMKHRRSRMPKQLRNVGVGNAVGQGVGCEAVAVSVGDGPAHSRPLPHGPPLP